MKLCVVTDFFVPHYQGGGERRYYEILKRLVKKNHHVDLVCMKIKGVKDYENIEGINVHHIGPVIKEPPKRTKLDFIKFIFAVCRYLLNKKYDIIEANAWVSMIPVSFMGLFKSSKTIAVIHDLSSGKSDQWIQQGKIAEISEKILLHLPFNKILTVGSLVKDRMVEQYKIKPKKIKVINNGVDIEFIDSIKETSKYKNTVVFVGRLIPHKHVDDLIIAMKQVIKKISNAKLVVVGSGQELPKLKKITKKEKLEKKVTFFGRVKYEKLIKEIKKSQVLVLPSTREGFGMVLVEAFACNTPCIAYYSDGVVDVIDNNKNGFLIKQRNINSLAEKIVFLLKNKKKAEEFAKNGRKKTIENFDWDIIAEKIRDFYES
ncbi:MAG: Trehalose synthase [Candidatus Woesearchaeota archaeon]|nr:Trehalose synthase [Candidatus Woesearchaeota archaeon]